MAKASKGGYDGKGTKVLKDPKELQDMLQALKHRGPDSTGFALYGALGIGKEDMDKRVAQAKKNYEFFGAPVGLFITVNKAVGPNGWGHVGHFIQNVCLSAVGEGLGTCLQEAWAGLPTLIKEHVGYGDDAMLWCGIALG